MNRTLYSRSYIRQQNKSSNLRILKLYQVSFPIILIWNQKSIRGGNLENGKMSIQVLAYFNIDYHYYCWYFAIQLSTLYSLLYSVDYIQCCVEVFTLRQSILSIFTLVDCFSRVKYKKNHFSPHLSSSSFTILALMFKLKSF